MQLESYLWNSSYVDLHHDRLAGMNSIKSVKIFKSTWKFSSLKIFKEVAAAAVKAS